MGDNTWLKITIASDPRLVEPISDYLVGVLEAGVETAAADEPGSGTVICYLQRPNPSPEEVAESVAAITAAGERLAAVFGVAAPQVNAELYAEEDWGATWKKHFSPFAIVPGLVIAPTWEEYRPQPGEKVITMDPGMAFGTGHHATTTLCLELLQGALSASPGARVLDVGTGTGILAMAALLFGASRATAIDNDPEAVAAARANALANGLAGAMEVSLTPLAELAGRYRIVVANIVHDVLLELAPALDRATGEEGSLILSGLLAGEQVKSIARHFAARGFAVAEERQRGEWAALALCRAGAGLTLPVGRGGAGR